MTDFLEVFHMDALKLIITILQLLCGLAIILAVLIQSGKSAGLSGAIGGVADSFLAKGQARTVDAKLARATKWIGAAFLVLTLVLLILA
jgi:preprotein translocase subunit SecG